MRSQEQTFSSIYLATRSRTCHLAACQVHFQPGCYALQRCYARANLPGQHAFAQASVHAECLTAAARLGRLKLGDQILVQRRIIISSSHGMPLSLVLKDATLDHALQCRIFRVLWLHACSQGYAVDPRNSLGPQFTVLPGPSMMWCDSKSAVAMAFDPVAFKNTKHILRAAEFLKHYTICGSVTIKHAKGVIMIADILTKASSSYFLAAPQAAGRLLQELHH